MNIKKLQAQLFNSEKAEKNENKGKNLPIADENKEHTDSVLRKISQSAASYYAALALAAGSTLASCQEQHVTVDNSEMIELIRDLIKDNQLTRDKLDMIILLLQENNADNATIIAILNKVTSSQDRIEGILNKINSGVWSIDKGVNELIALARTSNANDEEFLKKLDLIYNANMSEDEKLQAILDAINEQNKMLLNIGQLISNLGDQLSGTVEKFYNAYKAGQMTQSQLLMAIFNELKTANAITKHDDAEFKALLLKLIQGQGENGQKLDNINKAINAQNDILTNIESLIAGVGADLSAKLTQFYNEYKQGNMTQTQLLAKIYNELKTSNQLSAGQLQQLENIYQQLLSIDTTTAEGLQKVADLTAQMLKMLGIINNQLTAIAGQLQSLLDGQVALTKEMREFKEQTHKDLEDMKNGNITTNAFLAKIMQGIDNLGITDAAILRHMNDIKVAVLKGTMSQEEALAAITKILQEIKDNTDTIIKELGTLSGQIANLDAKFDANNAEANKWLKGIFDNTKNLDGNLLKMIKNQDEANKNLVNISGKEDQIIDKMDNLPGSKFTKKDLEDALGSYFNQIKPYLEKLGVGNEIDMADVIAAINASKTDLTKTNALIESLINVVQNLDFSSLKPAELADIKDLISQLIAHGDLNAEAAHQDYLAILNKLADLQLSLDDLMKIAKEIGKEQKEQGQFFRNCFDQSLSAFGSILAEIKEGKADIKNLKAAVITFADQAKAANIQQQKDNLEIIALLQKIVDKKIEMKGGEGLTKDELREVLQELNIPNYEQLLNDILEAIKGVITSNDLQNFFLKTQPDLTKTNALIESLTNVVQNLDISSAGTADMSKVEALLESIRAQLAAQQNPTNAQIQELIDEVNKIFAKMETVNLYSMSDGKPTYNNPKIFYVGSHMNPDTYLS